MKTMIAVTLALAALALGLDKVRNEHRMTEMYERQAVALERIAVENSALVESTLKRDPRRELIEIQAVAGKVSVNTYVSPPIAFCGKYSECR